jgi:1-phosphofructokinase family hexose kinase
LNLGEVNRFQDSQLDPAGKGVNVSRMVHRLGWPTIAFGFLAGEIGQITEQALDAEGVQHHFVRVPGQTRLSVTIVDRSRGTATSLYGPGPFVNGEALARLDSLLQFWLQAGRVLVLAGYLPRGLRADLYATYIRAATEHGVKTILDADGEPFRLGLAARPYLVKPNVAEAERLLGRSLPDLPAVIEAAREIAASGIEIVVISMGGQGAVCACGGKVWRAVPPPVEQYSPVGAGDSLVAGLAVALARGEPIEEGLRLGTAAGAATAMTPGTGQGAAAQVVTLQPRVVLVELA